MDRATKNSVLIWGGSSSVGLYALQIGRIHGFNVITTCSPRNFELVKSQGADHVFDYSDPDVISKIQQIEPNLQYVFDTIGNENSSALASRAISQKGGGLCTVRPGKANTESVTKQTKVTDVLVWTAFLKEHRYKEFHWPVRNIHGNEFQAAKPNETFSRMRKITTLHQSFSRTFPNGSMRERLYRIN